MSKPGLEARRLALEALLQTEKGAFAGEWIASRARGMSPADRGLSLEIALTSLRWKRLLDYNLEDRLSRWPGERVGWILRTALAQAWMLDRVPDHAAVDIAVDLARALEGRAMAGLVNAVLRRALAKGLQKPSGSEPRVLSIAHSHPEWMVQRWVDRLGEERTVEMLEADNAVPPTWVRLNPSWSGELPWQPEQILSTALNGRFLRLSSSRHELLESEAFRVGGFSFQDPGSGRAALALAPHIPAGGNFLDLCCAPGGKSALLAESGTLDNVHAFACDMSWDRQLRTAEGFARSGIAEKISVFCADGTRPPFRPESFDAILLDAPCSNMGVLSRRPEARWRVRPGDLIRQGMVQKALLLSALKLLKPGGVLAYSTCTVEPEETEDLIYPLFKSEEAESIRLDDLENPEPGSPLFLRTMPGSHGWDGFFTALLRKPEAD